MQTCSTIDTTRAYAGFMRCGWRRLTWVLLTSSPKRRDLCRYIKRESAWCSNIIEKAWKSITYYIQIYIQYTYTRWCTQAWCLIWGRFKGPHTQHIAQSVNTFGHGRLSNWAGSTIYRNLLIEIKPSRGSVQLLWCSQACPRSPM